jgi:alpha-L-fucosidase
VDLIWFDGLRSRVDPENLHAMMRGLQPHLLINNRNGLAEDFDTPEQKIGGFNRQRPWETCMTICRQWSWKPDDNMKDLKECLQTLIRTVGGDGNLLFNVGPMPDGRIEPRQVERLKEMGKWLEKYGDGIYGTRGGPCLPGNWGASTCKGNTVYLFVMQWPSHGKLALPSVTQKVRKCTVLSGGEATWTQSADAVEIAVPKKDQDEIATVIALEVEGNAFDMEPSRISQRSNSLAYRKKATATNIYRNQATFGPGMALDDDPETRWGTDTGTRNAQLEVDLGKPSRIGSVFIDERQWNRIRKFQIQYKDGEEWKTLLEGSTVGEAFSKTFSPSTAQHVRLNILEATDAPTIWEFQLFEAQDK